MARETRDTLIAMLRDEPVDWASVATLDGRTLLEAALREGVACLVSKRLRQARSTCPAERVGLLDDLRQVDRESALRERCAQLELRELLDQFAQAGVPVLLMKGAPLAYTHYPEPWLRPHTDYDFLTRPEDVDQAGRVLSTAGYGDPVQFPGGKLVPALTCSKQSEGICHVVDLHWKTSSRPIFGKALSFEGLMEASVAVAALGSHARTLKPVDALLLACMHRVSHYNSERLVWLYDIRLLLERLSGDQAAEFVQSAREKKIWTLCARSISIARDCFHGPVPAGLQAALDGPFPTPGAEPSARYLDARPWQRHLLDLGSLPTWRERWETAWNMTAPRSTFLRERYGPRPTLVLPFLYLDRIARGLVKMLGPARQR